MCWENTTFSFAIFLDNIHRFKDDLNHSEIIDRLQMGEDTLEDREEIKKRVISNHK